MTLNTEVPPSHPTSSICGVLEHLAGADLQSLTCRLPAFCISEVRVAVLGWAEHRAGLFYSNDLFCFYS